MRVQFLQRWRGFRPDQITDFPDGAANVLIRRGIAKQKRKRGRPPKRSKPFIEDVPAGVETP